MTLIFSNLVVAHFLWKLTHLFWAAAHVNMQINDEKQLKKIAYESATKEEAE